MCEHLEKIMGTEDFQANIYSRMQEKSYGTWSETNFATSFPKLKAACRCVCRCFVRTIRVTVTDSDGNYGSVFGDRALKSCWLTR